MAVLDTAFTEPLGLDVPIVQALVGEPDAAVDGLDG